MTTCIQCGEPVSFEAELDEARVVDCVQCGLSYEVYPNPEAMKMSGGAGVIYRVRRGGKVKRMGLVPAGVLFTPASKPIGRKAGEG